MGKTKPRVTYQAVSLPSNFVEEVRRFVKNDDKYRSMAEFTREAVTEKMNREFVRRAAEYESGKKRKSFGTGERTNSVFQVDAAVKKIIDDRTKEMFDKLVKDMKKKKTESNSNAHGLS